MTWHRSSSSIHISSCALTAGFARGVFGSVSRVPTPVFVVTCSGLSQRSNHDRLWGDKALVKLRSQPRNTAGIVLTACDPGNVIICSRIEEAGARAQAQTKETSDSLQNVSADRL